MTLMSASAAFGFPADRSSAFPILQHRPGEQVDLLLHHADGFAQALLRQRADVLPV